MEPGLGTLQATLDAAFNGDELVLLDGVYTGGGFEVLEIGNRNVTIRAQKVGQAFLHGHNARAVIRITAGMVVLDGLIITNGTAPQNAGGGLSISGSADVTLTSCSITSNAAPVSACSEPNNS